MKKCNDCAFSLIELALAIGVAAVCLLAIFGLLPVAQVSQRNAREQTVANDLTSEVISDLRATRRTTPQTSQTSPRFALTVGSSGAVASSETLFFREGAEVIGRPGTSAVEVNPPPRYRVTVFLNTPASGRQATTGRIFVTWPAMADPNPSTLPARYSGSLESFVALDRN